MNLSLFIARRYLFSPKKRNAINIISMISVVGVAVGTFALIVVLSVFNGIGSLLFEATSAFESDLNFSPLQGKFMATDSALLWQLKDAPEVLSWDEVIEETALVKYQDQLLPVIVKGVSEGYEQHTSFAQSMVWGSFKLWDEEKPTAMIGGGVAYALHLPAATHTPLTLYYPDRKASSASMSAIHSEKVYQMGIFGVQQEYDDQYILVGLDVARELFGIPGMISRVEVRLRHPDQLTTVKEKWKNAVGERYLVEDKFDRNATFYAMMRSEKLAIFVILLFILLIASFNIIGSITMLIIDKQEDIATYDALGLTRKKLVSIFTIEGNLITGIGALIGLVLGTVVCKLQEHYGIVKLGGGNYIMDAYPVELIWADVLLILLVVMAIGFIASWFPVKYLVRKMVKR